MNKRWVRIQRLCDQVPMGRAILERLISPEQRSHLVDAAEGGRPAVDAITPLIVDLIGDADLSAAQRQFVGLVTAAVLADEGYEPAAKGVRMRNNPVFSVGTVYRRVGRREAPDEQVLERMLSGLSQTEMRRAIQFLREKLGDVG